MDFKLTIYIYILYIHFDLFLLYINSDTLYWYLFYSLSWILPCSHFGQWECSRAESHQCKFTFRGTEPDRDRARDPPRVLHSVHTGTASSLYAPHAGHTVGGIHTVPVQEEVSSSPCLSHTHTLMGILKSDRRLFWHPHLSFFLAVRFCMWRWERFCPTVLCLSQCLSSLMWDHTSSTTLPVSHYMCSCCTHRETWQLFNTLFHLMIGHLYPKHYSMCKK